MKKRFAFGLVAIALAVVLAVPALADLSAYSQDFEGLNQADPGALGGDGWLYFANVFTPGGAWIYGYGPGPAPNGGPGFSGIDLGQGGPAQGAQQLVVYSDYNNGDHNNGNLIEANVFQERVVGAADVGSTWLFTFDAKRGNINDNSMLGAATAIAFIKTLDPNAGYALTNFLTIDTTNLPFDWGTFDMSISIDASLVGQIFQFGFANTSTKYQSTGVFYDNVSLAKLVQGACCTPTDCTEAPVDSCIGEYQGDDSTCGESDCSGPLKITMCHIPPGNPDNPQTITIGLNAAQAHIDHGDHVGPCGVGFTPGVSATAESLSGFGSQTSVFQQTPADRANDRRESERKIESKRITRRPRD